MGLCVPQALELSFQGCDPVLDVNLLSFRLTELLISFLYSLMGDRSRPLCLLSRGGNLQLGLLPNLADCALPSLISLLLNLTSGACNCLLQGLLSLLLDDNCVLLNVLQSLLFCVLLQLLNALLSMLFYQCYLLLGLNSHVGGDCLCFCNCIVCLLLQGQNLVWVDSNDVDYLLMLQQIVLLKVVLCKVLLLLMLVLSLWTNRHQREVRAF